MIEQHIAERLQIENAEFRDSLRECRRWLDATTQHNGTMHERIVKLERELGRARGWLISYGTHKKGCGGYGPIAPNNPTNCTCGLREELERLERIDKEEEAAT